jgi:hypothetical protein
VVGDPEQATQYIREWMAVQCSEGFEDSSPEELAKEVVLALHRKAREDEIEQKRQEFQHVGQDEFVLIESKWRVWRTEDGIQLWLKEWSPVQPYDAYEHRSSEKVVLELPEGSQSLRAWTSRT